MSEKPANPTAFPLPGTGANHPEWGMDLRDWFAGQALPGAMAQNQTPSLIALRAYRIADAMLAERAREDEA